MLENKYLQLSIVILVPLIMAEVFLGVTLGFGSGGYGEVLEDVEFEMSNTREIYTGQLGYVYGSNWTFKCSNLYKITSKYNKEILTNNITMRPLSQKSYIFITGPSHMQYEVLYDKIDSMGEVERLNLNMVIVQGTMYGYIEPYNWSQYEHVVGKEIEYVVDNGTVYSSLEDVRLFPREGLKLNCSADLRKGSRLDKPFYNWENGIVQISFHADRFGIGRFDGIVWSYGNLYFIDESTISGLNIDLHGLSEPIGYWEGGMSVHYPEGWIISFRSDELTPAKSWGFPFWFFGTPFSLIAFIIWVVYRIMKKRRDKNIQSKEIWNIEK